MIRAVVFDTDAPFLPAGAAATPVPASGRVAGLSLLLRAVWLAHRAGAAHIEVVSAEPEAARRLLGSRADTPAAVVLSPGEAPGEPVDDDTVLLLSAQVLPRPEALDRLLRRYEEAPALLRSQDRRQEAAGPALVPGRLLREALRQTTDPTAAVAGLLRGPQAVPVEMGPRAFRHLDTDAARRAADREMYHGLNSASDGWVDRVFNRRISGWFTHRIIDLPITPNQVTGLHFTLGMLAAALLWQASYPLEVAAALLYQLSVALDCSDGEVARLKYQFSRVGSWLDVAADNVVTVAIFAAVARSSAARLGAPLATALGVSAAVGVVMSVLVVFCLARLVSRTRPGEGSTLAVTNRLTDTAEPLRARKAGLVDRVINEVTSRDHSVLVVGLALAGRLEWFAWLAGVGAHVFWISFAAIQLALLRPAHGARR